MPVNIEFKAICTDPAAVRRALAGAGATLVHETRQTDRFLRAAGQRLKVRDDDRAGASLIRYRRLSTPLPRPSEFEKLDLPDGCEGVIDVFERALGTAATVTKSRAVYRGDSFLVNLDEVDGLGTFVELEVDAAGGEEKALALAASLRERFGLTHADMVPWSYAELLTMHARARQFRARLGGAKNAGRLILLDGASCSGKTTITQRLTDSGVGYVPRYTTRDPRPGEVDGEEYVFVDAERFFAMATAGDFVEFRDFEFGMSYGLPWSEAVALMESGRDAVGVTNLGSARLVGELFPEAIKVLVDVDGETIRRRLVARGVNKPHEIEERVGNARRVDSYRKFYDHIVPNPDGGLDACVDAIRAIITGG